MKQYICFDGGGTKIIALLFNEQFQLIASGTAGGINTNIVSPQVSKQNIIHCIEQLFGTGKPDFISKAYVTYVGDHDVLVAAVEAYAEIGEWVFLSEGQAGILAGNLQPDGMVALSGTGSDIFHMNAWKLNTLGGWGAIIGDYGSGVWMGKEALQACVKAIEGWGETTVLVDLICQEWELNTLREIIPVIYGAVSPMRVVGSIVPMIGHAAREGDTVAKGIVQKAGYLMATQTKALIRKHSFPTEGQTVVCCGGAWKVHPLMFDTFKQELHQCYDKLLVKRPLFEPVMAGVVAQARYQNLPNMKKQLSDEFQTYLIFWENTIGE